MKYNDYLCEHTRGVFTVFENGRAMYTPFVEVDDDIIFSTEQYDCDLLDEDEEDIELSEDD